ncbi:hypothetical protein IAU59_002325 [Kwoniella sp. CBS 9459]
MSTTTSEIPPFTPTDKPAVTEYKTQRETWIYYSLSQPSADASQDVRALGTLITMIRILPDMRDNRTIDESLSRLKLEHLPRDHWCYNGAMYEQEATAQNSGTRASVFVANSTFVQNPETGPAQYIGSSHAGGGQRTLRSVYPTWDRGSEGTPQTILLPATQVDNDDLPRSVEGTSLTFTRSRNAAMLIPIPEPDRLEDTTCGLTLDPDFTPRHRSTAETYGFWKLTWYDTGRPSVPSWRTPGAGGILCYNGFIVTEGSDYAQQLHG